MQSEMSIAEQRAWWDSAARENAESAILSGNRNWDPAEFYASGVNWLREHFDFARAARCQLSGVSALDFGCGIGRMTLALADRYERVTGVDISIEMVKRARAGVGRPGVEFAVLEGNSLPLPAASFDLVYSTIVVQHISAPHNARYVDEFFRVVKPSGFVLFDAPAALLSDLEPPGAGIFILPFPQVLQLASNRMELLALRNFPATNTRHYQYLFRRSH